MACLACRFALLCYVNVYIVRVVVFVSAPKIHHREFMSIWRSLISLYLTTTKLMSQRATYLCECDRFLFHCSRLRRCKKCNHHVATESE